MSLKNFALFIYIYIALYTDMEHQRPTLYWGKVLFQWKVLGQKKSFVWYILQLLTMPKEMKIEKRKV